LRSSHRARNNDNTRVSSSAQRHRQGAVGGRGDGVTARPEIGGD
jgi:hypothetical protein